jgi:hypothetical protein
LLERCLWCKRAGLQDLPMVAIIYVTEQERLWVTETIRRLHFDKFTSTMVLTEVMGCTFGFLHPRFSSKTIVCMEISACGIES